MLPDKAFVSWIYHRGRNKTANSSQITSHFRPLIRLRGLKKHFIFSTDPPPLSSVVLSVGFFVLRITLWRDLERRGLFSAEEKKRESCVRFLPQESVILTARPRDLVMTFQLTQAPIPYSLIKNTKPRHVYRRAKHPAPKFLFLNIASLSAIEQKRERIYARSESFFVE